MDLRRHDLVFLSPPAWRALAAARPDLSGEAVVLEWGDRGWPLVARRPDGGEGRGVALGLPLPPELGKRRLAFEVPPVDVTAVEPPPALDDVIEIAPLEWRPALTRVAAMASAFGIEPRVFGSLAWYQLTGLDYLDEASDIDLLFPLPERDVTDFVARLAAIDCEAPMRIDGELVRADGLAANWREIHAGAGEILVKTMHGISLEPACRFIEEATP